MVSSLKYGPLLGTLIRGAALKSGPQKGVYSRELTILKQVKAAAARALCGMDGAESYAPALAQPLGLQGVVQYKYIGSFSGRGYMLLIREFVWSSRVLTTRPRKVSPNQARNPADPLSPCLSLCLCLCVCVCLCLHLSSAFLCFSDCTCLHRPSLLGARHCQSLIPNLLNPKPHRTISKPDVSKHDPKPKALSPKP